MDDQPTQTPRPRQRWTGGPDRTRISRYQPRPNVEDNKEKSEYVFKHHDARRADALRKQVDEENQTAATTTTASENKNKMTNMKWGLVFAVAILLDASQFLIDWIGVGLLLNPIIDFVAGPAFAFYFKSQGVKTDNKKIGLWAVSTLWEVFTDGILPIGWIVDVAGTFALDKLDKNIPGI